MKSNFPIIGSGVEIFSNGWKLERRFLQALEVLAGGGPADGRVAVFFWSVFGRGESC